MLSLIPELENIDIRDESERSGFALAVRNEHFEIAQILFEKGADIHAKNKNGTTIFMYAKTPVFRSKNTEVLSWLIESGADINACDHRGLTALDYVKKEGDAWLESWMQENGAKYAYEL